MNAIIIGNLISIVSAVFTGLGNWTTDRKRSYYYQMWQCLVLSIAYIFFGSYAGISTLLICAVRNYLIVKDRYSKKMCLLIAFAIGTAGLVVNNSGAAGLLVTAASVTYTIASLYCIRILAVKLNILVNAVAWIIYEIVCKDYVSASVELVTTAILIVSLIRMLPSRKKEMI